MTKGLLRSLALRKGSLRGLSPFELRFDYPITAIAGKNGSGKSTILALACCAFHALPDGFRLLKRKNPYYTFSDFFVQHQQELSPQGLEIAYEIAHDDWKPTSEFPQGIGVGTQLRRKALGGKWNDYESRVLRTVVFLGIERIVPHSERSQSRSYSKVFRDTTPKGWEARVMEAVSFVLRRQYDDFRYVTHSKYTLPIVRCGKAVYSGFNMGAGENALFEIFTALYSAGKGALLVLDEIELGLHAEAQRRLVSRLKEGCLEMSAQVICTTHSAEIFDCLPPDARFYVEVDNDRTSLTNEVSSTFAFAKLSALRGLEADILVEDDVAKAIVLAALPAHTRSRVTIRVIGSASALARQLAALYVRGDSRPVLAIFDGDQAGRHHSNLSHARDMAENPRQDFAAWFTTRTAYLPGTTTPERWLLENASNATAQLAVAVNASQSEITSAISLGLSAGKHDEFHEVSKQLGREQDHCLQFFSSIVTAEAAPQLSHLCKRVCDLLL